MTKPLPKTTPLTSATDEDLERLAEISPADALEAEAWFDGHGLASELVRSEEEEEDGL